MVLRAFLLEGEEVEEDLPSPALEAEAAEVVVALWLITKSMAVDAVTGRPGTYLSCSARQQDSRLEIAILVQYRRVLEVRG